MGMFDYVNFKMSCPECGAAMANFQTKDHRCCLETVEPDAVHNFYAGCTCGAWVEFTRPLPVLEVRLEPLTVEDIARLGYTRKVTLPGARWRA